MSFPCECPTNDAFENVTSTRVDSLSVALKWPLVFTQHPPIITTGARISPQFFPALFLNLALDRNPRLGAGRGYQNISTLPL